MKTLLLEQNLLSAVGDDEDWTVISTDQMENSIMSLCQLSLMHNVDKPMVPESQLECIALGMFRMVVLTLVKVTVEVICQKISFICSYFHCLPQPELFYRLFWPFFRKELEITKTTTLIYYYKIKLLNSPHYFRSYYISRSNHFEG